MIGRKGMQNQVDVLHMRLNANLAAVSHLSS
jgi:hypothetical protein